MNAQATDTSTAGWSELLTARFAPALFIVCIGVWLRAADGLVVATKMPAMIADLGGAHLAAWNFILFEAGTIVAGAVTGLYAGRYGIRRPMILSAAIFALGCLISAVGNSMEIVVAGRVLQGAGGGALSSLSFVATAVLFPNRFMSRVSGAVSTFWGASAFLGPLIGAFFVTYASWRGSFYFFLVQALLLIVVLLFLKEPATPDRTGPDRKTAPTHIADINTILRNHRGVAGRARVKR